MNSPLYSTFGALYYFDPKFTPVSTQLANTDDPTIKGQTQSYNIAPMVKNSWRNLVYTRKELALMSTMLDPAVQMSLPNGLATPNRNGAKADLKVGFNDFVEVGGLFTMLKQDKSDNVSFKEAEFMEYGGGLKWNVFKMLGFTLPLELSGSYKHSVKTQELTDEAKAVMPIADKGELSLDFINAGLYVQYMPRLGLSAGLQMIDMKLDALSSAKYSPGYVNPLLKGKQMQWMVGLDYNIAPNAWLAVNFGMINVENEYNTGLLVAGDADGSPNLPDYYDVQKDATGKFKHEFSQTLLEASINVEF